MNAEPSTIAELLDRLAGERGSAEAIGARGRTPMTCHGLQALARASAEALAGVGCRRVDRVALVMENGPEMATACLCLAAAASCVPLNPAYTEAELEALMRRLRVSLVIATGDQAAAHGVAKALALPFVEIRTPGYAPAGTFELRVGDVDGGPLGPPTSADALLAAEAHETALVLHTSGSTAEPKIVPLSHRNLLTSAANVSRSLGLGLDDACLSAMPLFHIGALVDLLLAPLASGGRVIIADGMGAGTFFAYLEEMRPTWYQAVPTMLQDIMHRARSGDGRTAGSSLRFIRSVSAPLPVPLLREVEERFGVPVIEIYGMTETAGVITSNPMPPGERKPGSVGRPVGPDVVVVDAAGNPAPANRAGEVRVRGPSVMAGYELPPGVPDSSFVNGWLRTGDEGYLDADGYLYLTGRIKDIINRGGEKIAPREIDEVALTHPLVLDAAAFAVPHDTLGEDVALAVVPVPGETPSAAGLRAFCAARLAGFKVPHTIHFCASLPRAPGGKLQRGRLAAWCASGPDGAGRPAPAPPVNERQRVLVEVWQEVLETAPIGIHDDFVDLGGDSLRAVELAVRMSERLDVEIQAAALYDNPTVASLEAALEALSAAPPRSGVHPGAGAEGSEAAMFAEVSELVATWEGLRPAPDALLVGHNTTGGRPPLFWGVQGFDELRDFAERIGPEQPVWGMRWVYEARNKSPENLVALGRRYANEIEEVQRGGPLHIGGYCAGARLAFEVARQLRARGREIASLNLVEHFQRDPYPGRIAFFFGVESGWHPFSTADTAWREYCTGRVSLHPSRATHVDVLMDDALVASIAREVLDAQAGAGEGVTAFRHVPDVTGTAVVPRALVSRARRAISVELENSGDGSWPAGTSVFARWGRPGSARVFFDGTAAIPHAVPPGGRVRVELDVRAPLAPGPWRLTVQLVPGGDWNAAGIVTPVRASVVVLPGAAVWSYLRERLPWPFDRFTPLRRLPGRTA